VACEYSGRVRDAFLRKGHNAFSCDILPTEIPGPHYQCDLWDVVDGDWDLMIAHPPCTYLCNSGVRWLSTQAGRHTKMVDGATFFRRLLDVDIAKVVVENPVMHKHAVAIVGRRQDQIVQPWWFGQTESKATGLWLKGVEPLVKTNDVKAQMLALPKKETHKVHWSSPGENRWKDRSRTYLGIAEAMAEQWG
jgi:hypothetical protein